MCHDDDEIPTHAALLILLLLLLCCCETNTNLHFGATIVEFLLYLTLETELLMALCSTANKQEYHCYSYNLFIFSLVKN